MSTIFGTTKSNTLNGTKYDDLLAGMGGDDTLSGGLGMDTAWYSGAASNYLIGTEEGYLTLKDTLLTDGDDGTDRLSGIEKLAFSNGSLSISGGEFQVNQTTAGFQFNPGVAALADGGFVVTWCSYDQDGDGSGVYAQRYDAWGNTAGAEFRVNTYTLSDQLDPTVTALADGGFVVTWQSDGQDGDGYGIYAQRYDAQGLAVGDEFRVNTYTISMQDSPAVTALADGGFVVTWESDSQDGSSWGIYRQRFDAQGNATGSEYQINTYTNSSQQSPDVAALADGGFVVTWQSNGQDSSGYGIYAQRYNAEGDAIGAEFRVNTYKTLSQQVPAVAALADGGFVVTWASDDQDGDGQGIYAQRYDAGGNTVGAEFRVNTMTASVQYSPDITALVDGGFVVTWQSSDQDGSGTGVYAQCYDAEGNAAGAEFLVNTYTFSMQLLSSVTALADGGFVVTWQSNGPDDSTQGIFAQRYDAEGNAVGLKVTGTAGADVLNLGTGTLLTVDGAAGDDNLIGGLGADKLVGGAGDDRLDGGTGADTLVGGNGGDTYVVDAVTDVVQETGTGGTDTVQAAVSYTLGASLENLTLTGTGNINGTGNAQSNVLIGNSGNNVLTGGAGADLMYGGQGDDTYVVDNLFDLVAEDAAAGTDTVKSSVDVTLGDNVENLELTGTAMNGTGNKLDNQILGNAGNNTLIGHDGEDNLQGRAGNDVLQGGNDDDWLAGGLGLDTLTGGAGADIFRFDTAPGAANIDHITDFSGAGGDGDSLMLSQALFSKAGIAGTLSGAEFATGTSFAATDAHHILYNTSTGALYYNADGAGTGGLVQIAVLDGHPTLTAADIVLV